MPGFFDDYFNIKKMIQSKREYKQQMARVEALPEDYQYVFKKIQSHMWMFAAGSGYDMMKIHYDLIELFETGAAEGGHRRIASLTEHFEVAGKEVAPTLDCRHPGRLDPHVRPGVEERLHLGQRGSDLRAGHRPATTPPGHVVRLR